MPAPDEDDCDHAWQWIDTVPGFWQCFLCDAIDDETGPPEDEDV